MFVGQRVLADGVDVLVSFLGRLDDLRDRGDLDLAGSGRVDEALDAPVASRVITITTRGGGQARRVHRLGPPHAVGRRCAR